MKSFLTAAVILAMILFLCFSGMSQYEDVAIGDKLWDRRVDTDFPKNDLKDIMPITHHTCARLCAETPTCKGFVRDPKTQQCWLKGDMSKSVSATGRHGFILL